MPYSSKEPCETMARVSKAPIVACLTCPLCGNLFREATTISECLHTFCKDCIHDRFSDEETNSCPMCNVDLGTVPLEKLRADPQLDDVQAKIFNLNPKKRPAAHIAASPPSHTPARRKERSLSSLGVTSVPSSSRRRSRRKAWVTESSESYEEEEDDDDNSSDAADESPEDTMYCSETLDSDTKSPMRSGSKRQRATRGNSVGNTEAKQSGGSFLSPLACLAELAHADEKGRASSGLMKEARGREASSLRATKNVRRSSQAKAAANGGGGFKCQTLPSPSTQSNGLWFTLTTTNQGEEGLPQIKSPYLRIKYQHSSDGKVPVSFVKKYLVRKLDLKSESEVEITCKGQPVVSSLPLESVRKIWLTKDQLSSTSEDRASALGKDFLMVLSYGRNRRAAAVS
ncbi:E3 ubiquitin protein ligase DRIP2 isoform X1 [Selaginella moellendorffii]|uniref:E3 ubiquitin protein ligase DRIP2 isoform X1 n=1 Tax=Selaginella moellendorffii TaxID=88036 RepID=UPI000D1C80A4|nr:E3 ubiquitin protein ligase DRIP2 isoform X1 [Selaginella moellendorffii]|eukprot:XP_024522357.1 E3 ubiquitin protein ligase DRIP2 isoform X1 [Selaginella moellendorffii]